MNEAMTISRKKLEYIIYTTEALTENHRKVCLQAVDLFFSNGYAGLCQSDAAIIATLSAMVELDAVIESLSSELKYYQKEPIDC